MSSFKDLFSNSAPKSFVSESDLAAQREAQIAAYRAQGKEPPAHLLHPESAPAVDFRPLADRLAEQRRLKEEELEAKLSLRNHVPMLDEEDSEYLNDVAEQERREEEEKRRKERDEVERFRALQRIAEEAAAGQETGLDPEAVIRVVADRAAAAVGAAGSKSLVRELLLATDQDVTAEEPGEDQAREGGGGPAKGTMARATTFLGSTDDRKRKAKKQKQMALVVPKGLAPPSKRSASVQAAADGTRRAGEEEEPRPSSPVKKARTDQGEAVSLESAVPVFASSTRAPLGNGLVAYASDDDDDE